jgi:hypothetical protein
MAVPNYVPKRDVKMQIEFNRTTLKTCGGVKPGFRVQRKCSHGCDCFGTLITSKPAPDEDLAKDCAPCGQAGLSIKGQGKDVKLVKDAAGHWVFEMDATLFEFKRAEPSGRACGKN